MKDFAILTVLFNDSQELYDMSIRAFDCFPKEIELFSVVNKRLENKEYPKFVKYIDNDENCLARAWNIGLKELFKRYNYVIVSGLDSMSPPLNLLEELVDTLKDHPEYGLTAGVALGRQIESYEIKHGDGSFSFYCISKECYEKVGSFNEDYKPAYFEDDDYLERLWEKGYKPTKNEHVIYWHMSQGTVKHSLELKKKYAEFMNKNLALFKKTYGKVPDHLPKDIKFGT